MLDKELNKVYCMVNVGSAAVNPPFDSAKLNKALTALAIGRLQLYGVKVARAEMPKGLGGGMAGLWEHLKTLLNLKDFLLIPLELSKWCWSMYQHFLRKETQNLLPQATITLYIRIKSKPNDVDEYLLDQIGVSMVNLKLLSYDLAKTLKQKYPVLDYRCFISVSVSSLSWRTRFGFHSSIEGSRVDKLSTRLLSELGASSHRELEFIINKACVRVDQSRTTFENGYWLSDGPSIWHRRYYFF